MGDAYDGMSIGGIANGRPSSFGRGLFLFDRKVLCTSLSNKKHFVQDAHAATGKQEYYFVVCSK